MSKAKAARGALEALVDAYKKTFDPETYYHGTDIPNIKKFDPSAPSVSSGLIGDESPVGVTYFTKDEDYARKYAFNLFDYKSYPLGPAGIAVPGPMTRADARKLYKDTYFRALNYPRDEFVPKEFYGRAPTLYEVKIKTDKIFDSNNTKHFDDFVNSIEGADIDPNYFALPYHRGPWINLPYVLRNLGEFDIMELPEVQKILKERGFRGYKTNEEAESIALFYPGKGDVRSVRAKFDPAKSKSGNILASVPAAGLMALGGAGALGNLTDE
jgi:hypothetical protein